MTSPPLSPAEQLSALADNDAQSVDLEPLLALCAKDEQLQAHWRDYHLIGEVLRGQRPAPRADEAAFLARLRPALQERLQAPAEDAANGSRFGWPWLAAAASLALAAGVLPLLYGVLLDAPGLAMGKAPLVSSSVQGPIVRDAALEELLEAHRQQGGASELPMPSGFLRNATLNVEPTMLSPKRPGR